MLSLRFFVLFLTSMLVACNTSIYRQSDKLNNVLIGKTNRLYGDSKNSKNTKNTERIQVKHQKYLGVENLGELRGDPLPVKFEGDAGISIASSEALSLRELLDLISATTSIPVDIIFSSNDELKEELSAVDVINRLDRAKGNNEKNFSNKFKGFMNVDYKGPLSKYLDEVSSFFDIDWCYKNGRLKFSDIVVRTFTISTLPTTFKSNNEISSTDPSGGAGSSDSGSSSGNKKSNINFSTDVNFWEDLEKNLTLLLDKEGAFTISKSTSSVTIKTSPSIMKRIVDYIDELNEKLERQVTVNVEVYSVNIKDSSSFNASLKGVLHINGNNIASLNSERFFNGAGAILSGFFDGDDSEGNLIFNALDESGKVSILTSASVTTMSGQPVPLLVGGSRTYVSEIGTTMGQTSTTSTVSTSSITDGFSMNILPRVMDNGQVLLQYGIDISSLAGSNNGFDEVTVGDTTIQLPNLQQRTFVQSSLINNGNTLVLAGYEQQRNDTNDQGVGTPGFKFFGGSRSGSREKTVLVICITPRILNLNSSKHDDKKN